MGLKEQVAAVTQINRLVPTPEMSNRMRGFLQELLGPHSPGEFAVTKPLESFGNYLVVGYFAADGVHFRVCQCAEISGEAFRVYTQVYLVRADDSWCRIQDYEQFGREVSR